MLTPIEQYVVDYVVKLRKKHNLTQADIGVVINTTDTFVGNVENQRHIAKYNLNHISALASHFGMSPSDFLPKDKNW